MFGQVLEKLDAWFGRAFLLSRFFPGLLFVLLNVSIAYAAFPTVRQAIDPILKAPFAEQSLDLLVALVILTALSYAFAPFGQIATQLLEGADFGRRLDAWLVPLLAVAETQRQEASAAEELRRFQQRSYLPTLESVLRRLVLAREAGAQHRTILDAPAIQDAANAVSVLRVKYYLRRPVQGSELTAAVVALERALRSNCADVYALVSPNTRLNPHARLESIGQGDINNAEMLSDLQTEMIEKLIPYTIQIAKEREETAAEAYQDRFAPTRMAPTRLGNDAAALRAYCESRYGIQFDLFWPRFLLVVQKNDKLSSAIIGAKIQLDFAVLSLAFFFVSTVVWAPLLAWQGDSVVLMACVLAGGPAATLFWLRTVHLCHVEFANVVRAAIDVARFDVLQELRLPLPRTLQAERQVWDQLTKILVLDEPGADLTFKHPSK